MKFDENYARMEFWSCEENLLPEDILGGLSKPLTCKPRFLLILEGEIKEEIDGADYTKLDDSIRKHIPALDDWLQFG